MQPASGGTSVYPLRTDFTPPGDEGFISHSDVASATVLRGNRFPSGQVFLPFFAEKSMSSLCAFFDELALPVSLVRSVVTRVAAECLRLKARFRKSPWLFLTLVFNSALIRL